MRGEARLRLLLVLAAILTATISPHNRHSLPISPLIPCFILTPFGRGRAMHPPPCLPPSPLQALAGNTSLEAVDLSGNGLGADTCMVLGEVSPTPTPVSREPTLDPAPTATTHWAHLSPFLFPPSGAA